MRIRPPTSRAIPRIRFSLFDVCWAAFCPFLALYIRDASILSFDGAMTAGTYCATSLIFSLVAFSAFGVHDGLPRYFSVHDAIAVVKAVLVGELLTCVVLFTLTHLEGIPRSTPAIHALTLGAGLVTVRALGRITAKNRRPADPRSDPSGQHIIMIGLSDLSSLYMKCLEALAPHHHRVIAVLDERPGSIGRTINGVRVMGSSAQLEPLIEEFAVHGVRIDRVVVGGGVDILTDDALQEVRHVCARRDVDLEFVPRLLGLDEGTAAVASAPCVAPAVSRGDGASSSAAARYFRFRRFADFIIALVLITALLPLWALVASLAFLDVGLPLLFWQQRVGLNGCTFLTYKIRTLRPPFDWRGERVLEERRLSLIGQFLRRTRLDELPQLLNVLVGDMSLIGPRPLLPRDQPPAPTVRLSVRPGITGWAQVNGGRLVSPEEKGELDEWYIRNAGPWLDMRIVAMTLQMLIRGDHRAEKAQAGATPSGQIDHAGTARPYGGPSCLPAGAVVPILNGGKSRAAHIP
jgi:lipopolysaccharide/colanic/teichoic acid biosynthesis glycosyltransferase